jgi:hypothetical protein
MIPGVLAALLTGPAERMLNCTAPDPGGCPREYGGRRTARSFRVSGWYRGDSYEHHRMDRSRPGRRLGEPVNTATGPRDGRPPAGGRRVMSTGAAITVIAVGAILRFALAAGSPHGLNVHVVGVVLILAGVLGLLLSLLVRAGPRRPHSLVRQGRGGYYDLPGPDERLAMRKRAAAEDVAKVQGDDRFFAPDAPGSDEDDL